MKLNKLLIAIMLMFTSMFVVYAENLPTENKATNGVAVNEGIEFSSGEIIKKVGYFKDDLIIFGSEILNEASVDGDVIAFGQKLETTGDIKGNIRGAAQNITIKSNIAKNVTIAGETISQDKNSVISGSLYAAGATVNIDGTVNKDVKIAAGKLLISGTINGNLYVYGTESFQILEGARINGNVNYNSYSLPVIRKDAFIGGQVTGTIIDVKKEQKEVDDSRWFFKIFGFLTYISFATIAIFIFKEFFEKATENLSSKPGLSVITGAGSILLVFISIVLLLFSVIGILPAITLSMLFILMLIADKIVVALLISRKFVKNVNTYLGVIMGVALIDAAMLIPFIEFFVNLGVLLFGTGALIITLFESRKKEIKQE